MAESVLTAVRRSHYENAFEHFLRARDVAFVAVADARRGVPGPLGVKAFDYIVYPTGLTPYLVDVKGRKCTRPASRRSRPAKSDAQNRLGQNWVTRGDVEGLNRWQQVFGPDFTAAFVFAYWHADPVDDRPNSSNGCTFAGRYYSFWVVDLAGYRDHLKLRSTRWQTVDMPAAQFAKLARPMDRWVAG